MPCTIHQGQPQRMHFVAQGHGLHDLEGKGQSRQFVRHPCQVIGLCAELHMLADLLQLARLDEHGL